MTPSPRIKAKGLTTIAYPEINGLLLAHFEEFEKSFKLSTGKKRGAQIEYIRRVGYDRKSFQRIWENDTTVPLELMLDVCEAFKLPLDHFLPKSKDTTIHNANGVVASENSMNGSTVVSESFNNATVGGNISFEGMDPETREKIELLVSQNKSLSSQYSQLQREFEQAKKIIDSKNETIAVLRENIELLKGLSGKSSE